VRRLALAFASWLAASGAFAVPGLRVERTVLQTSCGDLVADFVHEWAEARLEGGETFVDLDARPWRIDEPAIYRRGAEPVVGEVSHRVGDGALRVRTTLAPDAGRFAVELLPEPAGDFALALAQYLPGVALPCRAEGRLALAPAAGSGRPPADTAAVYELLHRATELLYDQRFDAADAALLEAGRLAPRSDTVRWMRARVAYLEGEALPAGDRRGRLEAFARAERLADDAVALAPEHAEGWLWRGIARGRITTTQAGLSRALDVLRGERGPAWVATCFERAIALRPEYVHFGFSAAGDARVGAAQLYRLLPGAAWAGPLLGVARDLERSVALAREALALQPQRIEYAKELGVALLCQAHETGRAQEDAEARRVLRAALALPVRTPYERTDRRHVQELLGGPAASACRYSRDAWEAGPLVAEVAR
jgi:tetratricopeptide (TPR) repeat protein